MKITKSILINNLARLEDYLQRNPYYDRKWLHSLELRENEDVKGVRELLNKIPAAQDQADLIIRYVSEIVEEPEQNTYHITITVTEGRKP